MNLITWALARIRQPGEIANQLCLSAAAARSIARSDQSASTDA
jgi:hypothetical protein